MNRKRAAKREPFHSQAQTFTEDMRDLMAAHDWLLLVANATTPDNPDLAEVIAHEALSQTLGLEK